MLTQRNAIVTAMKERGWQLAEVDDSASEWWWDERLAFESRWTPVGARVFLTFLVDPQRDEPRAKGEAVWAVVGSAEPPEQRPSDSGVWLTLGQGWQNRLADFVQQIETFRTTQVTAGSDPSTVTLYRPVGQTSSTSSPRRAIGDSRRDCPNNPSSARSATRSTPSRSRNAGTRLRRESDT